MMTSETGGFFLSLYPPVSPTHAVHSVLSPSHPGPRALLRSPLATEPSAIHSLLTSLVHERSEVNGVSGARKGQRAGRYSRRSSAPLSSLSSSVCRPPSPIA